MLFFSTFLALLMLLLGFPELQSKYKQIAEANIEIFVQADSATEKNVFAQTTTDSSSASITSEKLEELENKLAETDKKREELENKIGEVANYNKDLMNTVFTSLLGTVVTITLGMLGINIIGSLIQREREKAEIIKEVQDSLQEYFLEWTSAVINNLQIRVIWLEYEIASLSATQLEPQGELERILALQERSRAIQAIQQLDDNQGISIQKCIIYQLEAIESLLEKMKDNSSIQAQNSELFNLEKENTEKIVNKLSRNLNWLQEATKDKRIKSRLQEVNSLLQKHLENASNT